MQTLIVTLIGPDKTGLIAPVAAIIQQHQGCWQASAMTELAGHFAGILEVQVPSLHSAPLSLALQQLAGLQVTLLSAKPPKVMGQAAQLTVTAINRPGIMAELTEVLTGLNISIKSLQTAWYAAPTTDTPIFEVSCVITLPHGQLLHDLQQQLQALSDDLVIDIDLIAVL